MGLVIKAENEPVLDFGYFALFVNASDSKGTEVVNPGQILDFLPRKLRE